MARTQIKCSGCNEFPRFTAVSFNDGEDTIRGARCNLCGTIRVIQGRRSPKREARIAAFEGTLQRLLCTD